MSDSIGVPSTVYARKSAVLIQRFEEKLYFAKQKIGRKLFDLSMQIMGNNTGNYIDHAEREMDFAGIKSKEDGPDNWMRQSVLDLVKVFSMAGHSGASAPMAIHIAKQILEFKPITPLTGNDDEWAEPHFEKHKDGKVVERHYQNKRCGAVFKYECEDGSVEYSYLYDFVINPQSGNNFTGGGYPSVPIQFPFMPPEKPIYVKVNEVKFRDEYFVIGFRDYDENNSLDLELKQVYPHLDAVQIDNILKGFEEYFAKNQKELDIKTNALV